MELKGHNLYYVKQEGETEMFFFTAALSVSN